MNLRKRITSIIATTAVLFSLSSGVIAAQPVVTDDSADTKVNVSCPVTASIDVTVTGTFQVNQLAGETSAALPHGAFQMKLDLRCNWSENFSVDATIGEFEFTGTNAAPGTADSFSGAHLSLGAGTSDYVGYQNASLISCPGAPTLLPDFLYPPACAPDVQSSVFALPGQFVDLNVMENEDTLVLPLDYAAPGVTTAKWNGSLTDLPPNLANGVYKAPLKVILTVQ